MDPTLAGQVIEDEVISFGDDSAGVSGELQTRVVRVAAGTLDFAFRVRHISGGEMINLNLQFFGSVPSIDLDCRLDGLGDVGPVTIYRTGWAMAGRRPSCNWTTSMVADSLWGSTPMNTFFMSFAFPL
jgi:hypothetical protein